MKMLLPGLVCCALACVSSLRAAEAQPKPATPPGQASQQAKLDQAITQQQAQLQQLQGDVAKAESRSHQNDEKLKQQDQTIADLQHQLDALKTTPKGGSHP